MDIIPTAQTAQAAQPAAAEPVTPSQSASSTAALSTDFDTFLTLLTAQLRYQDPLNPTDSTEFVAQLATFSALEQQILSNDLLTDISGLLSGEAGLIELSSWIGQEVQVTGRAAFDGAPLDIEVPLDPTASSSTLVIKDDFDQTVFAQPLAPGESTFTWDGTATGGSTAPFGPYTFEVQYANEVRPTGSAPAKVFVPVSEVQLINGAGTLVLPGGLTVPTAGVSAVRTPEAASADDSNS